MSLRQAIAAFDAAAFARRHGGRKEARSKASSEYLLACPECCSGRLRWNAQKALWICWGCRRTGDTLALVQMLERTDELGAIGIVMDGYVGGDAPAKLAPVAVPKTQQKEPLRRLPIIKWPDGVSVLHGAPFPEQVVAGWEYLARRGISGEMARTYKLAYGIRGRLRGYVVFPILMDGGLVYWQARATWDPPETGDDARRKWVDDTGYRKTLNPVSGPGEVTAADVLFNYDRASVCPHVVVCEGPIDAMKVGLHAVALLGKAFSPQKVERLRRMRASRYTVYLDRGEEERRQAERLAAELCSHAPTFLAVPPEGHDPGSLSAEQNRDVLAQALPFRPTLSSALKF